MNIRERKSVLHCITTRNTNRTRLFLSLAFVWICVWLTYNAFMKNYQDTSPLYGSSNHRDLLLFSYMRSGSTLTAELLRDSPGTFFAFEPLIPLAPYHYFTEDSVCKMRDTSCSQENAEHRIKEALDTVRNLFNCNIRAVPPTVISEILKQNKSGHAWNKYNKCLNAHLSDENKRKTKICLLEIELECLNAETRIVKSHRLGFTHVQKLLKQLPSLNVLLLYRDIRAIMNSRIQTDWFPVNEDEPDVVENNIESLCRKMETDFREFGRTQLKFSKRISMRKIEDVTNGASGMLDIFKFINKTATGRDKERINAIMVRQKKKYLFRDWTKELKPEYRMLIETKCERVSSFKTMFKVG